MDKTALVAAIVERLTADLETQIAAAELSHDNATSDETRSEGKYDTRALESAYLAEGQGRVARELAEARDVYRSLQPRAFAPGEPIALTALIELKQGRVRDVYFLGPRSGGLEFSFEGREVLVITPQSPLGRALLGKRTGDKVALGAGREANVLNVE